MKRTVLLCLTVLLALGAALAQEGPANPDPGRPRGHRGRAVGERWKQMDQDSDQRISRSEWKGSSDAFDRLDADKDGFLTRQELRSKVKDARDKRGRNFRGMDENNDGSISRSEWKGNDEAFHRLDANNDGVLSRDELRKGRQKHGRRGDNPQ